MTTNNKNTPITPYERPSQKWQCGKKDCGKACVNGPSNRGRCQTTHECQPVKVEDRWHCNRPLTHGGECENGPLSDGTCCLKVEPCKPKLSQRHYRIRAGLLALLLSLIVLTAFIMTKGEHGFFMPGDLHAAHSTAGQNCTSCHASTHPLTDTHQSALPLADAGAKTETGIALSIEPMNTNCVACHSDKTFAAHDLAPSLSAATNHQTTTSHQTTTKNQTQTACLDCHQAHQGNTAHLGALELSNCQTCHVAIEGLSQGHTNLSP